MLTPTWTARTRCGPLTARPEQVEARRPQLGRPRPSEEPRRSARPVGLARRLGEADPSTGMADQEAAPGGHEEEACAGNAARNYETLCGTTHGPEAQEAARASRARGRRSQQSRTRDRIRGGAGGRRSWKGTSRPVRARGISPGPVVATRPAVAGGTRPSLGGASRPVRVPMALRWPAITTRPATTADARTGPGGASRFVRAGWTPLGSAVTTRPGVPGSPRASLGGARRFVRGRRILRRPAPRASSRAAGRGALGGRTCRSLESGTGGTALRRGRGQARCTAHQGGVKTKSKRGLRSSREWGTTAQGVPALEDPPWEVGPRAGGGPARTTRRAVGPTRITIPRGGSGARCGDPGGVIASQGTVSRPCALRDGMDAWAPRATQVVTR